MALPFPTGHRGQYEPPGQPTRAYHCRCDGGPTLIGDSDTCSTCGKYPKDTIHETWLQRAKDVAQGRQRRRKR